jgi:hypothetical protein
MASNTRSKDDVAADPAVRIWRPAGEAGAAVAPPAPAVVPEIGGRKDGTDPTRFGDWEKNGRCIDF